MGKCEAGIIHFRGLGTLMGEVSDCGLQLQGVITTLSCPRDANGRSVRLWPTDARSDHNTFVPWGRLWKKCPIVAYRCKELSQHFRALGTLMEEVSDCGLQMQGVITTLSCPRDANGRSVRLWPTYARSYHICSPR